MKNIIKVKDRVHLQKLIKGEISMSYMFDRSKSENSASFIPYSYNSRMCNIFAFFKKLEMPRLLLL